MFSIKQVDTYWQYLQIKEVLGEKLDLLHEQGDYIQGEYTSEFEESFAKYLGVKKFIGVANGTDALELILRALNIGPHQEILVPNMTFFATYESVVNVGAKAVLVDINRNGVIDVNQLIGSLNENTAAVIAVHLTGFPVDLEELNRVCFERGIVLIEDACQAHNTLVSGVRPGNLGVAAAFSFYPGKNLGGFGDSGGIATNDLELADRVKRLRNHGRIDKYKHLEVGRNSRMDSLQAAVLSTKLPLLEMWSKQRSENAALMRNLLNEENVLLQDIVKYPSVHGNHLFPIFTELRNDLYVHLRKNGIQAAIQYPQTITSIMDIQKELPMSELYANQNLSLPIGEHLGKEHITRIAFEVRNFLEKRY